MNRRCAVTGCHQVASEHIVLRSILEVDVTVALCREHYLAEKAAGAS